MITGVAVEFREEHLLSASQESYQYTNLLGITNVHK